ncbi:MAG: peptide deformylase [Acidimicrobiales bacterium]
MSAYSIRLFGDPVLKQRAPDVVDIDSRLKALADDMIETMYDAPGVGLAAPQVGVQKRMFVYDLHDDLGPRTIVNPVIAEARGEWTFEEGCLSIPGLAWDIVRPKEIHLTGFDLDGHEISIEADEYEARVYQHEVDHLDGVLLVERLDDDQRKEALRILRSRAFQVPGDDADGLGRLPGGDGASGNGHGSNGHAHESGSDRPGL